MKLHKNLNRVVRVGLFGVFTMFLGVNSLNASNTAVITGDTVNVRLGASTDSEIVGKVYYGEKVEVVSSENGWYQINYNQGQTAYINAQFADLAATAGVVTANSVNIRSGASLTSAVLGTAYNGMELEIYGTAGEFYCINYYGVKAYIHQDYVTGNLLFQASAAQSTSYPVTETAQECYVVVTSTTGINFRTAPSLESEVTDKISYNTAVDVLEAGGEWHKVVYNGKTGYVSAQFTSVNSGTKPDDSLRTNIVNFSKQFLGVKYVYGGTSLTSGVDCSGFTYSVFKNFGITLNRTSSDQIKNGARITKAELQPGDLVFFDTDLNGRISHVGMYVGNNEFIHSSSGRSMKVIISSLNESYYTQRFVAGARVLN